MLVVRLAGPFTVERDGRPVAGVDVGSRKARTVLKLLAVNRTRLVTVDQLSAVLWPGRPPQRPADNVASLVSRLRATFGAGLIAGDRDGYQLGGPEVVTVDLDVAAAHLAEARRRAAGDEPALAVAAAQSALHALSAGDEPALADEPYADWAEPARTEAGNLVCAAREAAAEAALALDDPTTARDLAEALVADDPYDEAGYRLLMRAEVALGRPGRALAEYEVLRDRLATDFGVDPAPQTREVHLAILRERPAGPDKAAAETSMGSTLAGRDHELARLAAAWSRAVTGEPGLILIAGEAGIGKTRLAAELTALAAGTGGMVLSARSYEAERSLFLQPIVEALGQHAARSKPARIRAAAGDWAAPLAALVPEIAQLLGPVGATEAPPTEQAGAEVARRRAYDAVCRYLYRLADTPVLLFLDDLQNAGLSTVELLHYLVRQAGRARLLVAATIRAEEGAATLSTLAGVGERLDLGPLPADAVERLAAESGHADLAAMILGRTRGHSLFVVETLRGLGQGESGIPDSLREAVLSRVERTGAGVATLLRAASVLGAVLDPPTLGRLLAIPPAEAAERCEAALAARLVVVADRTYEFANDLICDVLYEALPVPARVAYHRQAADLLGPHPEQVARHAAAAGDLVRSARAWLVAGEDAARRYAGADAQAMLTNAIRAGEEVGDLEVGGRARLALGRILDAQRAYPEALGEFRAAARLARLAGDRRLEMMVLRELVGDVPVALGMSVVDSIDNLHSGLRIAESLGDRQIEADLLGRLAVISTNRLLFVDALEYGRRAVATARAGGQPRALAAALDGLKTAYAYLGEIEPLVTVLEELEPLVRRDGDLWRLQWALLESAFPAAAAGRWDEAFERVEESLAIGRRSGYSAYVGWFTGVLGWLHRQRGDLDAALSYAQRALDFSEESGHSWWRAAACAQYATTMLAAGAPRDAAIVLLEEGRTQAERGGAEAYVLQCLGPLAEATGSAELLAEADGMLRRIDAPPGSAWLLGADVYHSVARAWAAAGRPDRAREVLDPFRAAARRAGWGWLADIGPDDLGLNDGLEQLGEVAGGPGGAVVGHRPV
jgi:DNA-binding SARP family transcriptional activator/tetratricopeptide (TPR) repeat protein